MNELRYYQKDAIAAMEQVEEGTVNCVVMPCGTGKTAVINNYINDSDHRLTVIVFPRLALITQYLDGYFIRDVDYIIVGTIGLSASRDKKKIAKAINKGRKVVILTIYNSLFELSKLLKQAWFDPELYPPAGFHGEGAPGWADGADGLEEEDEEDAHGDPADDADGLEEEDEDAEAPGGGIPGVVPEVEEIYEVNKTVDCIIYDESHHTNTNKQDAAAVNINAGRVFYFTATPVDNHRNIIYKYSYENALTDGFSRKFVISVYATAQPKTPKTIYEMLGYFAKKHNLSNTILFHKFSERPGDIDGTSVDDFVRYTGIVGVDAGVGKIWDIDYEEGEVVDEGEGDAAADLESYFEADTEIICIKGSTPIEERKNMLERAKLEDNYTILHTCKTMSEGIDTQKITSICIIDEMGSEIGTTQAIGRIMRKDKDRPDEPSFLLIPFFGAEGKSQTQSIECISGQGTRELKGRTKKSVAGAALKFEIDDNVPRWAPPKNDTYDVDLDRIGNKKQSETISNIISFFAKDNPDAPIDLSYLRIDELHKKTEEFYIEEFSGGNSKGVTRNGAAQVNTKKGKLYYGCNEPLNGRRPKEVMFELANEFVKVYKADIKEHRRTGQPYIYAFADFLCDVVSNDDRRYFRYKDIEKFLDENLEENWEFGIYGKPLKVDARIIDIITNNRCGYPELVMDGFNTKWKNIYEESWDDKDFIDKWRSRQ